MTSILPFNSKLPCIHPSVFIASGAKVVGDVVIGKNSSIWFNTVVRGDVQSITIGESTNVQDNSILHVTNEIGPLHIKSHVTIGHGSILHACTIMDFAFIGMGAILLDRCVVEPHAFVAAGSLVKQDFQVPSGVLVAGVPAKIIRKLSEEEKQENSKVALRYKVLATQKYTTDKKK